MQTYAYTKKLVYGINSDSKHTTTAKDSEPMQWFINVVNNSLFKYFDYFCEVYACNKYLITSIYIFRFVSNFTKTIVIIEFRYNNKRLRRFI